MTTRAADGFWDWNDRVVADEMSQPQRIAWVVLMAILGGAMLAALWVCSR
ncbi:MAG: hypothetical protein LKI25_06470 [Atopobiaceae bacterium]|jgi:hypothetical protein|nr:hypothetical protein [Atopobiaceae bacterium]MCI2173841.1 hypothetical protein [Atopobiaceae bacterium]MCI2208069.1 hypothetical protein [Atopobiaceae bacterium]